MKNVVIVKKSEVKIKPFNLNDFVEYKKSEIENEKVTKKSLRILANELGLDYNDRDITFTKKIMTAYLKR